MNRLLQQKIKSEFEADRNQSYMSYPCEAEFLAWQDGDKEGLLSMALTKMDRQEWLDAFTEILSDSAIEELYSLLEDEMREAVAEVNGYVE